MGTWKAWGHALQPFPLKSPLHLECDGNWPREHWGPTSSLYFLLGGWERSYQPIPPPHTAPTPSYTTTVTDGNCCQRLTKPRNVRCLSTRELSVVRGVKVPKDVHIPVPGIRYVANLCGIWGLMLQIHLGLLHNSPWNEKIFSRRFLFWWVHCNAPWRNEVAVATLLKLSSGDWMSCVPGLDLAEMVAPE